MKKWTLLFLLIAQLSNAQSHVTGIIDKIDFKQDTVKAVYDWIADNVKYDVKMLRSATERKTFNKDLKFANLEEYHDYRLKNVAKSKKGVCQDYSLLFDAIMKDLGYESYIIDGYTKNSNGRLNRSVGHTWNAIYYNNMWKLYDVTWGAGYVKDGKKFIKKYNEGWYDVDPEVMIKDHMPFDPMWQLSSTPISYRKFEKNLDEAPLYEDYDYESFIDIYQKAGKKEQMQSQLDRSMEMGDGMRLVTRWQNTLTNSINIYGVVSQQDALNDAFERSKNASELFNDYFDAKNKQFKGKKRSIEVARQKLEESKAEAESALEVYNSIEVEDKRALNNINKSIRQSENFLRSLNKEIEFINKLEKE